MTNLRMTWWLDPRPTMTMDWLMDDHLEDLIKTCGNVVSYLNDPNPTRPSPAVVKGWSRSHLAMCVYGALACQEHRLNRYGGNTWFWNFANVGKELVRNGATFEMPVWFEDEHIMQSHWSAGLRHKAVVADLKVPWTEVDEYWPVLWPVITENGGYELRVNKQDKAAMEVDDLWLPDDIRARVVNL